MNFKRNIFLIAFALQTSALEAAEMSFKASITKSQEGMPVLLEMNGNLLKAIDIAKSEIRSKGVDLDYTSDVSIAIYEHHISINFSYGPRRGLDSGINVELSKANLSLIRVTGL